MLHPLASSLHLQIWLHYAQQHPLRLALGLAAACCHRTGQYTAAVWGAVEEAVPLLALQVNSIFHRQAEMTSSNDSKGGLHSEAMHDVVTVH